MSDIITNQSVGVYDSKDWLEQGNQFLATAKLLRQNYLDHRETFSKAIPARKAGLRDAVSDWALLEGLPISSHLLLGYAVEMYLKAGWVKFNLGNPKKTFLVDLKSEFKHDLDKLAKKISFEFANGDESKFEFLRGIMTDGRYPLEAKDKQSYIEKKNSKTSDTWNEEYFNDLCHLAGRVLEHASRFDRVKILSKS